MAFTCTAGWADLPLDLLDGVIARLPFPGDRARFAAVCRAWRSAARERERVSYFPWIALPYGTLCSAGRGAAWPCSSFVCPGFPKDTTCLGAAHDCWLALDRTDDVFRRRPTGLQVVYARPDVKHRHAYMLHNPFSNATVPLLELDAVIGHVAETFELRKVLMRSPASDDVIAVTTNNMNCNIILCRPGKGVFVLPYYRVIDVVFLGDILYGITYGEELLAFHLGEHEDDGRPNVTRIELVIKNLLAHYYHDGEWLWPQAVVDASGDDMLGSNEENEDDPDVDDEVEEEPYKEENDNDIVEENQEEGEEDINEWSDNDELLVLDQALVNDDEMVQDNVVFDGYADGEVFDRFGEPHEAKDELHMGRYLVQSRDGELLLVKHQRQTCPYSRPFTRKVEVFKADFSARKWAAASDGLAKGEAIFLSRSYSKCTRARGDIQEGFVYYGKHVDDVFDTTSYTVRKFTLGWPWQCSLDEVTWLFPPEVVV